MQDLSVQGFVMIRFDVTHDNQMGMTLKKSEILFLSCNVRNPNRSAHSFFFFKRNGVLPSLFAAAAWNQWPDKYVFRVFLPVHEKISKNSHNKRKKMYVHSAFTNFFSIWPQKWPKVTEITLIWKKLQIGTYLKMYERPSHIPTWHIKFFQM